MPSDAVLLPLCLGISLLGVIGVAIAWHHRHSGRVIQAAGVVVVPFALYLTGLLGLVVEGAAALGRWAVHLVFNPITWTGLSLLGVAVVLWVVGGVVSSRQKQRKGAAKRKSASTPATTGRAGGAKQASAKQVGPGAKPTGSTPAAQPDDDFAEIEALLKKHGIE